jgi:hypothetical protein
MGGGGSRKEEKVGWRSSSCLAGHEGSIAKRGDTNPDGLFIHADSKEKSESLVSRCMEMSSTTADFTHLLPRIPAVFTAVRSERCGDHGLAGISHRGKPRFHFLV